MPHKSEVPNLGVGMPHFLYLNQFGKLVFDVFGSWPYLVGSSTVTKQWRDIDVRLILSDEEYERWCGKFVKPEAMNHQWSILCMAFAELGKRVTGLPIDFQIQPRSYANETFGDEIRCALIMAAEFEDSIK